MSAKAKRIYTHTKTMYINNPFVTGQSCMLLLTIACGLYMTSFHYKLLILQVSWYVDNGKDESINLYPVGLVVLHPSVFTSTDWSLN